MLPVIVNILLFVLVIGILTLVHELGHFISAKLIGAKVYEFALGWGPKIYSKKYKGTLYSIRVFPIGGFVKILGDGDPGKEGENLKNDAGSLKNKPKLAQIFVMLAGVIMNVFFAIAVYQIVIASVGWKVPIDDSFEDFDPVGAVMTRDILSETEYSSLVEGGNAESAGIPESGAIASIDGVEIVYSDQVGDLLAEKANSVVLMEICVEDNCDVYDVEVSEEGTIGIMLHSNYLVSISYEENKGFAGVSHLVNTLRLVRQRFGEMFDTARSTGDYSELSNSVSGPVGIYFIIDYFKSFGVITFLSIVGDLSMSLAIMNIIPIPALDGGRVLILLIEGILRKDLDERVENLIINISFILLIIFVIVIMIKDIASIDKLKDMFG